jgi:hypothetical protein
MVDNYCWGCRAEDPAGRHLKSYWHGEVAVLSLLGITKIGTFGSRIEGKEIRKSKRGYC